MTDTIARRVALGVVFLVSHLVADSHSIVDRWRNYFSQLFNVHGVKDVGQTEIHTAEPPVLTQALLRLSWLSTS